MPKTKGQSVVPTTSCDTARSSAVTPSRSYRTFQPALLPHEETLVIWWSGASHRETFDAWMMLSHRCAGACAAVMDYPRGARAAEDYSVAGALAIFRALTASVTPTPASVSQGEKVAAWESSSRMMVSG